MRGNEHGFVGPSVRIAWVRGYATACRRRNSAIALLLNRAAAGLAKIPIKEFGDNRPKIFWQWFALPGLEVKGVPHVRQQYQPVRNPIP